MENIFLHILPLTLKGCVVIPIIFLLRFFIRKYPKIITYPLWIIVFMGLIFDIKLAVTDTTISPVLSVYESTLDKLTSTKDTYTDTTEKLYFSDTGFSDAVSNGAPVYRENATGNYTDRDYVVVEKGTTTPRYSLGEKLLPPLYFIWFWVVTVGIGWFLYSYMRMDDSLKQLSPYKENIWFAYNIPSPFVSGIIKPKIYIPAAMDKSQLDDIILHEKVHIRHKDNVLKPFCFLVCILHWFNPLVWLAYRQMCRDMEMAADEAVINTTGNKKAYAHQLLSFAQGKFPTSVTAVMFGQSDVEKRIVNILNSKKMKKIAVFTITAILTFCCGALFITTSTEMSPNELTFLQQLKQVATTAHIPYRTRQQIFGPQSVTYNGYDFSQQFTDDHKLFVQQRVDQSIDGLAPHQQMVGTVVDKGEEGQLFYYTYITEENDHGIYHYKYINGYSQGCGGTAVYIGASQAVVTRVVSCDLLADDLSYQVFYTKPLYTQYGQDEEEQLTILKKATRQLSSVEYRLQQVQLINDHKHLKYKDTSEFFTIPTERVGQNVTGARFLNENLGFVTHAKDGFTQSPQVLITVDGCQNWYDMDFSNLTLPEKFTGYSSRFLHTDGDVIKIELDVQYPDGSTSQGETAPYMLFSEDCGVTWAGFVLDNDSAGENVESVYKRVTDFIPAKIK